jgi:ABC-type bacteriocin/lantibiotic exporter with double-glycine peptidase domain
MKKVKQLDFPKLRQTFEYDCGANALESILVYYGIEIREELLIKYAKTNPKTGTTVNHMLQTLKKYGLKFDITNMDIKDLKKYIDKKIPIILLLQAWNPKKREHYDHDYHDGHYVVATGYAGTKIFFQDPYSFERTFLTDNELEKRWHAKEKGTKLIHQGIAVYGKKPVFSSKKIVHMG